MGVVLVHSANYVSWMFGLEVNGALDEERAHVDDVLHGINCQPIMHKGSAHVIRDAERQISVPHSHNKVGTGTLVWTTCL